MGELKRCPCGKDPKVLCISETSTSKWLVATGICCSEWAVEFRSGYRKADSDEVYELAREAWNDASRDTRAAHYEKQLRAIREANIAYQDFALLYRLAEMGGDAKELNRLKQVVEKLINTIEIEGDQNV